MKQKKLIRLLSLLCLIALVTVSTAYAYGTSSNWAVPELDAMEALGLIPQALAEKPDLRICGRRRTYLVAVGIQSGGKTMLQYQFNIRHPFAAQTPDGDIFSFKFLQKHYK